MQYEVNRLRQPVGRTIPGWTPPPVPDRQPLFGRLCRVEPLDPAAHATSLYAAISQDTRGRMWTYLPYGPFDTPDSYRSWLVNVRAGDDPAFYAIVDAATRHATGLVSYQYVDPANGSIGVGNIAYAPPLQGTPAATEAMYLMMERVFALGYRRYECRCDALDVASRKAARRLGFSFEGVLRQAGVVKGRNRDVACYAVLDREWPVLREAFLRWLRPENFSVEGKQRTRLSELTGIALRRSW